MQEGRKFAFDVSWVFVSQIAIIGFGLISNIILGRWLGAANFGLYSMSLTLYTIAAMIAGFGIPYAIVKYAAEYKEERGRLCNFASCSILNTALFGIGVGVTLFVLSPTLAGTFGMPQLEGLIRIVAISVPFMAINTTILNLLTGLREMKFFSSLTMLRSVSLLLTITLFVAGGWGVTGSVLALLCTEAVLLFFTLFTTRKLVSFSLGNYFSTSRVVLGFGSQLFLAGLIQTGGMYMDTLLVGFFLTAKDVGIYTIAIMIARTGFLAFPAAMSMVTYPAISEFHSKEMNGDIQTLVGRSVKSSLVILTILGLLLIFFSQDLLLLLFKQEFLPALIPLYILVFGAILYGSIASIGSIFSGTNRPDVTFKLQAVTVLLSVLFNYLLIPSFGIIGAAMSTAASLSISAILGIYLMKRLLGFTVDMSAYVRLLPIVAVLIILYYFAQGLTSPYVLSGILFFLYVLYVYTQILTQEDKTTMYRLVRSILKIPE